jgi:hypothetical protein
MRVLAVEATSWLYYRENDNAKKLFKLFDIICLERTNENKYVEVELAYRGNYRFQIDPKNDNYYVAIKIDNKNSFDIAQNFYDLVLQADYAIGNVSSIDTILTLDI